jgi:hypothetical protein
MHSACRVNPSQLLRLVSSSILLQNVHPPGSNHFTAKVPVSVFLYPRPSLSVIQKKTWYSSPDIQSARHYGEVNYGTLFSGILVALGLVGAGTFFWRWETKKEYERMERWKVEPVLKCEDCGKEIPSHAKITTEGQEKWAYCAHCKKMCFVFTQPRVPHCSYCNAEISGVYYTNSHNEVYCGHHLKNEPYKTCFFCSRHVFTRKENEKGGLFSCENCVNNAMKPSDIPQALNKVKTILKDQGIELPDDIKYPISIVKEIPAEISFAKKTSMHRSILGRTETRIGLSSFLSFGRKNWVGQIVVLDGLDPIGFEKVLAHELGHVYLHLHKVAGLPPDIQEGVCNLISYIYLRELCKHDTKYSNLRFHMRGMEKDTDNVYGKGFRKVFNLYFKMKEDEKNQLKFIDFLDILKRDYAKRDFHYHKRM